jgi:small-conductance mechanosensitive channel
MSGIHWLNPSDINFGAVIGTAVILAVAVAAIALVKRYIGKLLDGARRHFSISYETSLIITRSAAAAVWIVAAMLILNLWGIGMSGLWTLLVSTAAVVGVGFLAVWTIISNVTASLFLTIWRPFHLGQTVEILPDGMKGRAVSRDMMFTALHEESGSTLQIPNNIFFQRMFRVSGTPGPLYAGPPENGSDAKAGEAARET